METEELHQGGCCQAPETMGECGDRAHALGVFYLDGMTREELAERREQAEETIKEEKTILAAIDAKLAA